MKASGVFAFISRRHKWVLVATLCVLLSGSAFGQADEEDHEKHKRETDKPRQRQMYIEDLRGATTSQVPPGARLRALEQMDEMIKEEGERYWKMRTQSSTAGASTSTAAAPEGSISDGSTSTGQWLFIGPRPTLGGIMSSGRTSAMVLDSRDGTGNTVYVGGAQGGVWKTTDGGATWTPLTDFQPSLAIGSLAIDATTNPSTIYAGTGEQGFSFDSYYGAGVLKSTDGGTTWTQKGASVFAGPLSGCQSSGTTCGGAFIGGLSVRPGGANPATILAAVSLAFSNGGVFRSTDGGDTWTRVLAATTNLGATAVQYATSNIAYAGLDTDANGTAGGMYRSDDGGATWTRKNGTGPNVLLPAGRIEFAVALSDATGLTVYASVGNSSSGAGLNGFYKTTDGGENWIKLGPNFDANTNPTGLRDYCTPQCWYDNVVAVSPVNANIVFVGGSATTGHISKSLDGGATWVTATGGIHVDHHSAAFTTNGSKLYWGNDGGVYSTTSISATGNNTTTWTNLNNMLGLTQFYSFFALHPTDINITLGGTQDNGTQRYDGTQPLATAWTNVTCGDGASNVIDHFNPSIVYANCQNIDIRKSTDGGFSGFGSCCNGAGTGVNTSDRVLFIPPMVGDNNTQASNVLYFGTYRVYQTRNEATSWQPISNDLTSGGSATITNMAVSQSDRNVMYVVTRDGRIWRGNNLLAASPNDCATLLNCFTEVTNDIAPASRRINAVAIHPTDPNTVYVGHAGFGSSTSRHLSRSTNGGANWGDITNNLPNTPVNDIVVDPDIANTLYVATDVGVFRSSNNGASWSTVGADTLPRVAVYGLKLHRQSRTLRAVTHGRGVWDLAVPATTTGPGAMFSPSSLNFSSRPVGTTSSAQNINFQNNGTSATTVSNVSISGDFAISANACASATVQPNGSCQISVTFTPTATGQRNGTLTVTSNAASSPTTASLSGSGGPPNDNFADAIVVNSGTFTHSTNTLGATVEANDQTPGCATSSAVSKTVWYVYTPGSSGQATLNTQGSNYDTILSVWTGNHGSLTPVNCDDDGLEPGGDSQLANLAVTAGTTYRIMVSGFIPDDGGNLTFNLTGPAPQSGQSLTLSPSPLNVSAVVGRATAPQAVTFTNNSGGTVTFSSITVTGDYTQTNNCVSVANGQTCTILVVFTPAASGARNGTLTVNSSAGTVNASLNGTGVQFTLSLARPTRPGRTSTGSTIVIEPGGSAVVELAFHAAGASAQVASFRCSGSGGLRCDLTPASVSLAGSDARSLRLTITSGRAARLAMRPVSGVIRVTAKVGPDAVASMEIPVVVSPANTRSGRLNRVR